MRTRPVRNNKNSSHEEFLLFYDILNYGVGTLSYFKVSFWSDYN